MGPVGLGIALVVSMPGCGDGDSVHADPVTTAPRPPHGGGSAAWPPGARVEVGPNERMRVTRFTLPTDVLFASDSADLSPAAADALRFVVRAAKEQLGVPVIVEAHADGDGSEDYNLRLSQRRGTAVAAALVSEGVAPERIETRAYGESRPAVPGDTPEAKAANRRVEIVIAAAPPGG